MDDTPQISPDHKIVSREDIAKLPKVILSDQLGAASSSADVEALVRNHAEELAHDGVIYAELRFYPEACDMPVGEALDAAVRGLDTAEGIDGRLIVTPTQNSQGVQELAEVSVDKRKTSDRIVGFGVENTIAEHRDTLRYLREHFVPVTVRATEAEEIAEAVAADAQRIAHGVNVIDDFDVSVEGIGTGEVSTWIRDRGIAMELSPTLEESWGLVEEYSDHPLTLLQQMGFACVVSPGQTDVISTTDEFNTLVNTFDYGLDELFDLTRVALEQSFAPIERRQELLHFVLGSYETLTDEADLDAAQGE